MQPDPVQPAADPGVQPAPAVDPGVQPAPVVDPGVQPAADPGAAPAVDPGVVPAADPAAVPADAQPAADPAAAPADPAPAAEPQEGNDGGNNNNNNNDNDEPDESEETVETVETEETTVPIVIMDAQGNLITVTPTPTPFPRMSGSTLSFNNSTVNFPFKKVAIGIIIIAVLGTRYFMLKSRGLRGGNLALEFVPGVSDVVEKIQRKKGTKIQETPKTETHDYSQSTAARAAEAAREAQQARAEFAKAQAERRQMAQENAALAGTKPPVKRTSSAPGNAKAKQEPEGIKMAPGFKFTAPIPGQSWTENPGQQASPFKSNAAPAASASAPSEEAAKKSPFQKKEQPDNES